MATQKNLTSEVRRQEKEESRAGRYQQKFEDDSYRIFRSELEIINSARGVSTSSGELPRPGTEHELVGLALSGGGIRSATFNLGFMQALYRAGIMKRVDYLSTVSGGGYIGSCLTSLLNSTVPGVSDKDLFDVEFPFAVRQDQQGENKKKENPHPDKFRPGMEKEPVRHLRYFSNYLTAGGNMIIRYVLPAMVILRGMVLNFCLILPYILLAGIVLAVMLKAPDSLVFDAARTERGSLFENVLFSPGAFTRALDAHNASKQAEKYFVLKSGAELTVLSYREKQQILEAHPHYKDSLSALERARVAAKKQLVKTLVPLFTLPALLFGVMLVVNVLILYRPQFSETFTARFTSSRTLSYLLFISLGLQLVNLFCLGVVYWGYAGISPNYGFVSLLSFLAPLFMPDEKKDYENQKKPWGKLILSLALFSLAPFFLLYLTGIVGSSLRHHDWTYLLSALAGTVLFWMAVARFININKVSLHSFYRDRLSRAYLIQHAGQNKKPFDRIQHCDDLKLHALKKIRPYHILNTNLNLTKKLPPDQKSSLESDHCVFRDGENFIFSRQWCGSGTTGYMDTATYESRDTHVDLGTAMAISGAAFNIGMANNNMPVFRLLMGLFNIRLGYWALRPTRDFCERNHRRSPGCLPVLKECLGDYSLTDDFINLSDGGQFDNIGVYELLRRRCKYIIVGDAEADCKMSFQALSYIIRLARIDFGIQIDIDISDIIPGKESGLSRNHCAVGLVRYPRTDDLEEEWGYLLYCKSLLSGDETQHLFEYKTKNPDFPHQTTADQWFDEQQFEVYRELGYHVGKDAFSPVSSSGQTAHMEEIFIALKQFWHPQSPAITQHFTRLGQELNEIIDAIKRDPDLEFLDGQMFPEWDELMGGVALKPDINFWMPGNAGTVRKGFYVCNQIIQLMENVYLDLDLEATSDHPDNRGWMNQFRHWSWSAFFRITWSISACTFGSRFQRFCEQQLGLDLGEISAEQFTGQNGPELTSDLNKFERMLVEEIISRNSLDISRLALTRFSLVVRNVLHADQKKEFGFGFVLFDNDRIVYFRVQDHLRDMGLGRKALQKMHDQWPSGKSRPEVKVVSVEKEKIDPGKFARMLSSAWP